MQDDRDYIVEIGGKVVAGSHSAESGSAGGDDAGNSNSRPYIHVMFECCGVYQRIYRNKSATAYEGYGRRGARPLRIKISPGGTSTRFFSAG